MSPLAATSLVDKTLFGEHASDGVSPRTRSSRRRWSSPVRGYAWHSREKSFSKEDAISGTAAKSVSEVQHDGSRPSGDVENQVRITTLVNVDHRSILVHRVIKEVLLIALFIGIAIRFCYWVI